MNVNSTTAEPRARLGFITLPWTEPLARYCRPGEDRNSHSLAKRADRPAAVGGCRGHIAGNFDRDAQLSSALAERGAKETLASLLASVSGAIFTCRGRRSQLRSSSRRVLGVHPQREVTDGEEHAEEHRRGQGELDQRRGSRRPRRVWASALLVARHTADIA